MSENEAEVMASSPAASIEDREVLQTLLNEPRTRRDAETMEWLVREHDGERLVDIASERGLPAPVVRQRVSRLRRALRSRWLGVVALLVLVGGLAATAINTGTDPREAIGPDPSAETSPIPAPASATSNESTRHFEGDWTVQTIVPNRPLTPTERRLVDLEAKNAIVHIRGKGVTLETKTFKTTLHVSSIEKLPNNELRVHLTHETGFTDTANVALRHDAHGPRLEVTFHGPHYGGTVTLRRPVGSTN